MAERTVDPLPPTLEDWAAEWAAEHPGEPGPVREWTSEDGRVWWRVDSDVIVIGSGALTSQRNIRDQWWFLLHGITPVRDPADVSKLAELMAAADGAGAP